MNGKRDKKKIQNSPLVIDGHFDLLMDVQIQRERGRSNVIETDYYPRFVKGGVDVVVASIFVDSTFVPEMALRKALGQISALYEEVADSSDKLMICYNAEDMEMAKAWGKIGFLLSIEGAEPLGNDLSLLRVFYELGVRNLGLVWSRRNAIGDGSHFQPVKEGRISGITEFGVRVIEEAEKLGITIDVSHLNDEGFWDVIALATKPVIASHSNARTLCSTMRNLADDQIVAIAKTNGVIGVNAASMLVGNTDEKSDMDQLINHLDYLVDVAGINHVGIGLDLCDDVMKYVSSEDLASMPRKPFDVIPGHQSLPEFIDKLSRRGYDDEAVKALLGGNFLRIFKGGK
ncbi:dipeptidase [Ornithinibacillus salinisoli]|uniref:Dipeptidase n=1 Tax=Ornithinibacillus salinisoli TaxID=1848459 RepID=A0ABW4VZK1_9BACI